MPGDIFSDDLDAGETIQIPRFGIGQEIFSRYTLQRILGRGGMGVVWLARDEQLENFVALKVLPETLSSDPAALDALKRETKLGLNLAHPNIVRIYDFQQDESAAAIAMEYVDGPTLSDLRIKKPNKVFSTAELLGYVEALSDALNYAHTREKIVHRDLKPRNLMLNSRGELKIADFGISRSISESMTLLTGKLGSSGSPPYISPQQWDGERPTPLDDIYSVGATLYELLSGKPPLIGIIDWQQVHHKVPPPIRQRRLDLGIKNAEPVSVQWEETIAACLEKEPKNRPQTIRELHARLTVDRPATGTLPILSAAPSAVPREDVVRACPPKDPKPRQQLVIQTARELAVSSPKTREAQRLPAKQTSKRISLLVAAGVLLCIAVIAGWSSEFLRNFGKPRSLVITQSSMNEPKALLKRIATTGTPAPSITALLPSAVATAAIVNTSASSALARSKPVTERPTAAGPKVIANVIYEGTIHVKNDSPIKVPLAIMIGSDLNSGTMIQSGRSGDVVVKFNGVWDGATLRAVTGQVVSQPKTIQWNPESFTLHFAEDGKHAIYECVADGKTYVADLSAQSAPVIRIGSIYKGTIRLQGEHGSGTSLTINLAADRKSGTMTQMSRFGDTVVRFNGIWGTNIFRAVTNEVISKPKNIQWKPESFTLHFAEDGKRGSYECNSEGRLYTAELFPP